MANLGQIISEKSAADAQWQQQRQAERDKTTALGASGKNFCSALSFFVQDKASQGLPSLDSPENGGFRELHMDQGNISGAIGRVVSL